MRAKHLIAAAWVAALLSSGCLRLMDRPAPEGSPGTECERHSECAEGAWCLKSSSYEGTCGEVGQCDSHSQCGDLEACLDERCVAVECTSRSSSACGNYPCNDSHDSLTGKCTESDGNCSFTCKTSCAEDRDCLNATICRAGKCVPSACTAANAAVICLGYSCDTVLSECRTSRDGCAAVGCATGFSCVERSFSQKCRKACVEGGPSDQCGNYQCEPIDVYAGPERVCRDECSQHTDCLNGTVCVDGVCAKR